MGLIGQDLDSAAIYRTLKAFGIGGSTGSGLGSLEAYGTLNESADWNEVAHASISYGYGVSVTPLQLARAYAAIASGGLLPPISFKALDEVPDRAQVIGPDVASDLMRMLEAVVASDVGTAKRAAIEGYRIAGKTGTVRILEPTGYSDVRHNAIFAGIAPASRPRFVAVVFINDPQVLAHNGGDIAAPVFAKIISAALSRYGVAPDGLDESMLLSQAELRQ
jgi:cell division protein FtsI (penicillin-binding protein 3)